MSSFKQQQRYNSYTGHGDSQRSYQPNLSAANKQQPLFNIQEVKRPSRGQIPPAYNNLMSQELIPVVDNSKSLLPLRKLPPRNNQSAGRPQGGVEYPGQLPTLGLNRYRNIQLKTDDTNPFSVQKETEKLLVAREREREQKDQNKYEKEGLRVFEKSIQTRQNRAGIIREINTIRMTPQMLEEMKQSKAVKNGLLMLMNVTQEENQMRGEQGIGGHNQNKQKLNIFDEQDSSLLKHETLARLGFEDKGLMDSDDNSMRSSKSFGSNAIEGQQKPKAIEYLSKGREQKESVRDFIQNSRKILVSQIAINDKTEETERLKEYIIMEREKLEEAKKTFDEDRDKFQKYMDDLNRKAEETENEVQKLTNEKNDNITQIQNLTMEIQSTQSEIKRIDEQLIVYKQSKNLLDAIAISAGKKQEKVHDKNQDIKVGHEKADTSSKNVASRLSHKIKDMEKKDGVFMTALGQVQNIKKGQQEQKQDDMDMEFGGNAEEEDDDFEIYFDKYSLLEHLQHLEEDNLFKIHLVQEDEQALEKLKKSIEFKIQQKQSEINDVLNNIKMLNLSRETLANKQGYLESNMKIKQNTGVSTTHNNWVGDRTEKKSSMLDMPKVVLSNEIEDKNSAFYMLQQQTGATKEQINRLNQLITNLLIKTGNKGQDDQTDKIEMLRKLEYIVDFLLEMREATSRGPQKKELEELEKSLHNDRRNNKIKNMKLQQQFLEEERSRKNMQRIQKQLESKIIKGRKSMQRAKKNDPKPKQRNEEKPSEEELDQIRYIGEKIYQPENVE